MQQSSLTTDITNDLKYFQTEQAFDDFNLENLSEA